MNVRYRVELSQGERDQLDEMLRGGKQAARRLKRAQILLAADTGVTEAVIATTVGVGVTGGENPRLNGDVGGLADRPSAARLPSCSRPSRTRDAASRWPSAILDCRCARRRRVRRSGRRDGRLDRTTGWLLVRAAIPIASVEVRAVQVGR